VPTLRRIATIGHPILRQVARPLSREELLSAETQAFIDDLIATMHDAAGAGLAAIQVYEPIRICAIEVKDNPRYPYKPNIPLTVLVNPVITPLTDETFANYEGCLSVPNLRGIVERVTQVRVTGWNRKGEAVDEIVRGLSAGTFQHEVDHLDGKLFVDRVKDTTTLTTWQDFERYHQAAFVKRVHELVAKYGS
jgi:peptide deformylase